VPEVLLASNASLSTPLSSQEEEQDLGKCHPKKCSCDDKCFDNVCEYFVDIVEDYELKVSGEVEPPPTRPTRETLIGIATEAYWLEKASDLNVDASYFKLDLPLPICFHRMLKNIDVILLDFE
jgi:hypothetical protein